MSGTKSSVQSRVRRYLPLLFWMALIFSASTGELSASNTSLIVRPLLVWLFPNISEERIALAHFLVRKAAHFTEYAVLGLLMARAFRGSSREFLKRRWFAISLLLIAFYALSDEFHQSFVASRTASVFDSMIDTAGGLAALLWYRRRRRKESLS